MQQVTRHVLERVVAQLAQWNGVELRLRAAVNVSVLDLSANDFEAYLLDTLRRYGIPPRQLDIELAERSMVADTHQLDEAAERIARVGVGISLDDFGTGFASLRRLRSMPLTKVKVDRSYVSRIAQSPEDRAIVTAIHDLTQVLGLRLVAEGVEDEATVRILAKLDNVVGQGWYYARPRPTLSTGFATADSRSAPLVSGSASQAAAWSAGSVVCECTPCAPGSAETGSGQSRSGFTGICQ